MFDSHTGQEFPDHKVFAVSYEPLWQVLRASLSFKTVAEARGTLAKLEAYMGSAQGEEEIRRRVFRVHNLLNALPLGQTNFDGISNIQIDVERHIVPYRKQVAERARVLGKPTEWDWDISRKQLAIVMADNPASFKAALTKLKGRASRKEPKPELRYYLTLIEEVTVAKG